MTLIVMVALTSLIGLAFFFLAIRLFYSPALLEKIIFIGWPGVTFALALSLLARGIDIKNFLLVLTPFLVTPVVIWLWINVMSERFEKLEQNKLDEKESLKSQRRIYYASLSLEEKEELLNKNSSDIAYYEGSRSYQKMMKQVKKSKS